MLDHPQEYLARRAEIAAWANHGAADPVDIDYLDVEHETWESVASALIPLWDQWACDDVRCGREQLRLDVSKVPQLGAVNRALESTTGVTYAAVDGILPGDEFFGFLADSMFPSTQYVRWSGSPWYTPEPDIIHEVLGHASLLADPVLAELHRRAGQAGSRGLDPASTQMLADVFWFTAEFGVVRERGELRAYGAGLLSSPDELATFHCEAETRPLDCAEMLATPYRTDRKQPILFVAESLEHVLDEVGGFFDRLA